MNLRFVDSSAPRTNFHVAIEGTHSVKAPYPPQATVDSGAKEDLRSWAKSVMILPHLDNIAMMSTIFSSRRWAIPNQPMGRLPLCRDAPTI